MNARQQEAVFAYLKSIDGLNLPHELVQAAVEAILSNVK